MRLRWTEEEFLHLSNHRPFLAFLQDFNLMMTVFHLKKFSVLNPFLKFPHEIGNFLPMFLKQPSPVMHFPP